MTISDDELDRRLSAADASSLQRVQDTTLSTLLTSTREIGRRIASRQKRRRIVGFSAIGVIAISAAVSLPAAAEVLTHFLAQTDKTCSSATECGKTPTKFVNTTKSDTQLYVESVYPAWLPLPPSLTREKAIAAVVKRLASSPGLETTTGIENAFENVAYCGWTTTWLSAHKSNDRKLQAEAADAMSAETGWPGFAASADNTVMTMQKDFAAGAASGDAIKVIEAQVNNACDTTPGGSK
jgi:hypothetical protein